MTVSSNGNEKEAADHVEVESAESGVENLGPVVENQNAESSVESVVSVVPAIKKSKPRELMPCAFCGQKCRGEGGIKRHLHFCNKNPYRDSVK